MPEDAHSLAGEGVLVSTLKWCNGFPCARWHGEGGLLDYTNPEAVQWWHSQMDNVLSLGIDGWKVDGTGACVWTPAHTRTKKIVQVEPYPSCGGRPLGQGLPWVEHRFFFQKNWVVMDAHGVWW